MRLLDAVDQDPFAAKGTELRDRSLSESLDDDTTEQILTLLQRVNRELGTTLLMVTHHADAATRATRQLRLERSQLIDNGKPILPRVMTA